MSEQSMGNEAQYSWGLTEDDRRIAALKEEYYRLTEREKLYHLRAEFDKGYGQKKQPKIFIYTPTYNRGCILKERALKSVLEQTYQNFEYLIVGDGCTDCTEEVVKEVKDPRIRFFQVPQRAWRYPPSAENHWLAGPVVAANTALRMATGDYIARIDDDDSWVKDHLQIMLETAIEGDFEFVSGMCKEKRDGLEKVVGGTPLYGAYFQIPFPDGINSENNPLIGGTSSIFYRSYLRYFEYNIDCWRKKHNRVNDIDLYTRFGMMGVRIGFVPRVEFYLYPRPGETTVGSEAYKRNPKKMTRHFR